ncbi:copper transporter [Cellulomonas sp. ATA003]|uniref:copper transporter n=1 Tax=Cellulomonas sp. ATA003 TaxID=3073064 RepID=UPI002873A57C|nr:copper transporter [Cellulomonas sp. ATA003]WNB86795.1 copper transporter [Cellulomonas sp. ATA003]
MIDFRYHIVSLISVFLALAVGIVLGAGPLRETIGDTLTGQVESLREEMEVLRSDLAAAQSVVDRQSVFLDESAPQLVGGTLTDRRVAVVTLGTVDDDARAAVEEQLLTAGATISARVQVTDQWTDPALREFRGALAGSVVTYLDPAPAADAGAEVELAQALAQGLTGADPADPNALSEPAELILQLLASDESDLITVAEPITAPADAVVLLAGEPEPLSDDATEAGEQSEAQDAVVAAHLAVVSAAQERSEGALLAGGVATPGDLVTTVLADADLAADIATVTGFRGVTGQLSVPLGLNARIGGQVGHYGFGDGLTPVPEPVTLPEVDRTPAGADDATTDDGTGTEGTGTDGTGTDDATATDTTGTDDATDATTEG